MRNTNEPDWRRIDQQRRSEDATAAVNDIKMLFLAAWIGIVLGVIGLFRLAPLIVAVFAAIILAKCTGVI